VADGYSDVAQSSALCFIYTENPFMFGIRPKLPVSEEDRAWVENGFDRLSRMLGRRRMLDARVILPDAEHFPDPFDKTSAAAEKMFGRICDYMKVDRGRLEFEIFADETHELRNLLPYWSGGRGGCAGLYQHPEDGNSKMVVAVRQSHLEDPLTLVAVLAHELGHVILLGDGLINQSAKDMEPMTDLLTVFLGFGIFNGNCSGRFQQWQSDTKQGWSMQRLGYLPEEVYGYALARFAQERGEHRPDWIRHLSTNLRSYFKRSAEWLRAERNRLRAPVK
jgi:hypothetical protein